MISPLKGLKKPKGLKGLSGLGKQEKLPPLPDLDDGPGGVAGLVDDELARLTDALGDEQLAKRIIKMKKKEYPAATYPELVAIDWCERHGKRWGFQIWVMGGRKIKGGQVLDLIIDAGLYIVVIEIQGDYWHTRPGKIKTDEAQRLALMGVYIWGKPVKAVVEVWESRLMTNIKSRRDQAMNNALSGKSMGPA